MLLCVVLYLFKKIMNLAYLIVRKKVKLILQLYIYIYIYIYIYLISIINTGLM